MSVTTLVGALARIGVATSESPIAVFRADGVDSYDVMFAATSTTRARIAKGDPDFIGIFDGAMDMDKVRSAIRTAPPRSITHRNLAKAS